MKLTPDKLKMNAAAMLAFAEGRPVECLNRIASDDKWTAITHPCWNFDLCDYRPKPEPKTRPWTAIDVPPVCWLRNVNDGSTIYFPVNISRDGVEVIFKGSNYFFVWSALAQHYEYSTDLKVWKLCTVEVTK